MHDVLSGKSVIGVFCMTNMTLILWNSKKAAIMYERAIYGAECLAAWTCVEHIVHLRNSFRYLGVSVSICIWNKLCTGDNESQVKSSTIPYDKLNKRHAILFILPHYVCQIMVSKGFINTSNIGAINPIIIWTYNQAITELPWILWKNILLEI